MHSWVVRYFSIKDNKMLFSLSESDTSHKQINLNQEYQLKRRRSSPFFFRLQCEEVNQAKEPEFKFTDVRTLFQAFWDI